MHRKVTRSLRVRYANILRQDVNECLRELELPGFSIRQAPLYCFSIKHSNQYLVTNIGQALRTVRPCICDRLTDIF